MDKRKRDEICTLLLLEKAHLDFVDQKIEEYIDDESKSWDVLATLMEAEQKSKARINILKQSYEELTQQPDC